MVCWGLACFKNAFLVMILAPERENAHPRLRVQAWYALVMVHKGLKSNTAGNLFPLYSGEELCVVFSGDVIRRE